MTAERPQETVREALQRYLQENGFSVEGYNARWTEAAIFGLPFYIPNTRQHRWAIMLHDLHHVATGYGTDLAGEGEISAWEVRRGLAGLGLYVGSIVVLGAAMGFLLSPRRAFRAFEAAGDGPRGRSLFQKLPYCAQNTAHGSSLGPEYERLLELPVTELQTMLAIPPQGLARERGLHARAPEPDCARDSASLGAASS